MVIKQNAMKKKAITICFILSFLISSFSFFFFQANVLATNDLESKYSTINDADNLYDSVPYWFNASLYDPDDLTRDFQSGLLSIEKEGSFEIKENFTLLNDFNNNYWDNLTEFNPTFKNGSYSDGVFYSSNVSFNYDYGFHPETNYNETLYNQIFTSPDGSMSHNYQPEDGGYNSSYSVDGNLTIYNEFPSEEYWEFWSSYNYSYDPLYTTSTFNRYNYATNASVQSGNGEYISGDEEDLKYGDSQYFKAKSVDYLGDEILYIDFDFSSDYNWDDLDGDYFLFFQANDTMNFRDKNHQNLWNGSEAWGILLTDVDDYIYVFDERMSSFSIQIDFLFLLDPKLISQLNYQVESIVPSDDNPIFYHGSPDPFPPDMGKTGTDIAWVDYISGGSNVEIISTIGSHRSVLEVKDEGSDIYHYISSENAGSREFWVRTTNAVQRTRLYFWEGGLAPIRIKIESNLFQYHTNGEWNSIVKVENDVWYHVRVDWRADNKYDIHIDGIKRINDVAMTQIQITGISKFEVLITAGSHVSYLDAWGDPADPNYNLGDNRIFYVKSGNLNGSHGNLESIDGNYSTFQSSDAGFFEGSHNFLGLENNSYHGNYSFDNDINGVDPAGWTVYESTGTVNVVNGWGNHSKVVNIHSDGTGSTGDSNLFMYNKFSNQTTGTIEFWAGVNDYESSSLTVYDDQSPTSRPGLDLMFLYNGSICYYDMGTGWRGMMLYNINTWYHFRIEFNCSEDHYHLWINNVSMDGGSGILFQEDPINMNTFGFVIWNSEPVYDYYIDAVDYSWSTKYYTNRNYRIKTSYGWYYDNNNFNDEIIGTTGTDINFLNSYYNTASAGYIKIVENIGDHKNVLQVYDHSSGGTTQFYHDFSPLLSGTNVVFEFWYRTEDNTKAFTFACKEHTNVDALSMDINGIAGISDNIWYHFKFVLNTINDNYTYYIDGVLTVYNATFDNSVGNIGRTFFRTNWGDDACSHYIDAFAVNIEGKNINPYDIQSLWDDGWFLNGIEDAFNYSVNIEDKDGHSDCLHMKGSDGAYGMSLDFTDSSSGTIEYWIYGNKYDGWDNNVVIGSIHIFISGANGRLSYYLDATYNGDITSYDCSGQWNHVRIDVVSGVSTKIHVNGVLELTIPISISPGYISLYQYNKEEEMWIDGIGLSWYPNYDIGDNLYDCKLNFTVTINLDDLVAINDDPENTLETREIRYSFKTNQPQMFNISIYNFDTSQFELINSSNNYDSFYELVFTLNLSCHLDSFNNTLLRFEGYNHSNTYELYLEELKIFFSWTKTSGNIETSLTKSIVFDFLNHYDSFDNYLKLYRFDYIFNYRFINTSNHARSAKFNAQNLNTDGSWHLADFYDIYDSSTGDGTINLEFLISNGILEIRTFQYSMWFGCVNLTGGRRILQQIFAVEFPNEGDLSEYVKTNGMFLININYSFSTEGDGYDYANTYGRHNKLEIHYAFKADGAWYYAMVSTNSSITKNTLINITDVMNGLGLSDFEDFAVTFVMIGNSSQITVFNVSLWDTRAVVPAFLNFTFDHEFTRDYLLNYFELLYDWNTTAYTLINFSIYDFQNNTYNLLKSDYNTGGDSFYSFVSYLFNYYQDSDNKTHAWIVSDYNYTTAFSLNLSINFNYRTAIWVSHKLTFDERGVWRYRFVLTSSGGEYSTEWIYFDVIEPIPNFQAVSKSDYITNWILMSNDTMSNIVTRFSDDLMGGQWELTGVPSRYVWYEVYPYSDSWVDLDNPDINHGSETILKVSDTIYNTYIEDIHIPEDESDYFIDNVTGRPYSNFRFYGVSGTGDGNLYFTTDFDEHTITWNNKPAKGGSIGWAIPLGSGWKQFYNIPYTNPGRYVFTSDQPPGSYQNFYSKESGSNKPYFRHYVSKNYHDTSSGYFYMQTDTDETLSMISSEFSTTQTHANDFILIDCQTLNSDLDVIFLKNGAVVKTLPLVRDNTNYYRRSIEVLIDEDISFDQIKISGQFSDMEYFKCYDVKIQGYEFEEQQNIVQFGVAPDSSGSAFVPSGENILKIYDNGILKVEKTITLTYDDIYIEEYVGLVLETVYFSYYDVNNEPLGFDYFKIFVNYTIDNRTILNEQLFDNFLFVDDESTINFNVYDTFNILITSIEEPETTFIKIVLDIYSLKVKNEAIEPVSYILKNPESSIEKSSNIFPDEIIEFKISSGNYIFDYINGEDNALRSLNFTLNDNKIVVINSTYYQLYIACFNFDGLGLDTDWVRLYINNLRKDFGFNTMKYEFTNFVVLDYFNASLADETVYTKAYTEYNIYVQVYNLILNNNYSHSIYIEITRPDVDISVKQVIPSQSGINYRFLPEVDYIISYYHINGTKIGDKRITLDTNNQIVSFGFYSEEVPSVPVDEIVKFENSMFLDIIVIILCFIIVIAVILYFYRKIYKKNKQQQQYIYNKNINKKKLEVDGLFGKIK